MPRQLAKPKRPTRRPGESIDSLDARWRDYERRLLGDPLLPHRPEIDPSLAGVDRSRELALTAIMDRFQSVGGVGILHKNKDGKRFALRITGDDETDAELLTVSVGRLLNHSRRLGFFVESQRFDETQVRVWVQHVFGDGRADDAMSELRHTAERLGLIVVAE